MLTSQQVREGGDSEQDDDDSGCAVFSCNLSSDDGADSKNSSGTSDGGQFYSAI